MNKKSSYYSKLFTFINDAILKNKSLRKIKKIYYYIDGIIMLFTGRPKKQITGKKKVILLFNLALGDGVMFMTVLKNIKNIYPKDKYEITLACQNGLNKLYEKMDIFDKVLPLKFTDSTVNLKNRIKTIKELRKEYYDIALDPVGIEEYSMNVLMTRVIHANEKIGIKNNAKKMYCSKRICKKVYSKIIEIDNPSIHYIELYNEFFNKLGNKEFEVEFLELPSESVKEKLPEKYCIIYPSASTEFKRWPVERFADIAKKIFENTKLPIVLCGTEIDRTVNNKLKELIKDIEVIDMIGKTSILEYISLIKNAKYVVTNDTGIYHIATISQRPVAVIGGGYSYDKYLVYRFNGAEKYKKPYVICKKMDCFNCENRCIYCNEIDKTWPCLEKISVSEAWKIINKMIEENK